MTVLWDVTTCRLIEVYRVWEVLAASIIGAMTTRRGILENRLHNRHREKWNPTELTQVWEFFSGSVASSSWFSNPLRVSGRVLFNKSVIMCIIEYLKCKYFFSTKFVHIRTLFLSLKIIWIKKCNIRIAKKSIQWLRTPCKCHYWHVTVTHITDKWCLMYEFRSHVRNDGRGARSKAVYAGPTFRPVDLQKKGESTCNL
jgi:hypothetical protein